MKGWPFAWLLAACAAAPAGGGAVDAREVVTHRVRVRITFEPPLVEPGWLVVEHESGVRERLPTSRSGVEVMLPPGPASLRLEVGGRVWERPVVAAEKGAEIVWRWGRED